MFKKVAVAISGGVDSAVTALLLKAKDFDVTAVFMKNWDLPDKKGICQVDKDIADAKWICEKLEIPFVKVDFVKDYWNDVFSELLQNYELGLNSNLDINCNKKIKFNKFFNYARNELQADCIATGHYARSSFNSYLEDYKSDENAALLMAVDAQKDQTFFLSQISQNSLRRTMFPLGDLYRKDVISIAREANLTRVLNKKENRGMCSASKRQFQDFLLEHMNKKPGNFINIDDGKCVGKHKGIHFWTLGQKCRIKGGPSAYFVCRKDRETNNIYVASKTNHSALFCEFFVTSEVHWISSEPIRLQGSKNCFDCEFKFKRTQPLTSCTIFKSHNNQLFVRSHKPLRAVTPGQYAVLYSGEECLGSAEIAYCCPLNSLKKKAGPQIQGFAGKTAKDEPTWDDYYWY